MPRLISVSKTLGEFARGQKTETRRMGWVSRPPKVGEELVVVAKAQGLKRGERAEVLGFVRVLETRREPLNAITAVGCANEGFPGMSPTTFVEGFRKAMRCPPDAVVTVIRWEVERYTEAAAKYLAYQSPLVAGETK